MEEVIKKRKPKALKPIEKRHIYSTTTAYCSDKDWEKLKKLSDGSGMTTNRYIFDVLMKGEVPYKQVEVVKPREHTVGKSHSITGLPDELEKLKAGAKKCGISVGRYIFEVLLA